MITPNQQKWLDALRSSKYKQGFNGYLRMDDCYCPYGVLADISGLAEWMPDGPFNFQYLNAIALPPKEVLRWLGFTKSFYSIDIISNVIKWNDKDHKSFPEIADLIEAALNE